MKSNKKEPLPDLIKSLTKTEKRYFYIFSKQHQIGNKNNYLFLFETIILLEVYNEKYIKNKVKKVIAAKDFAVTKSYLYKMLLKSLNAFYKERISIDSALNETLLSIEILYHKALYTQSLKLCKKGIKKSLLYEKLEHQLLLEKWQYKVLQKLNSEDISLYEKNTSRINNKLNNNIALKVLSDKVYDHVNQLGISRTEKETKTLKELLKSNLLKTEKNALGTDSKILYNNTKALYHYFNREYKKSYTYYQKSLDLLDKNPMFLSSNPEAYISTSNNFIINHLHLENREIVKERIQNLKNYVGNLHESQLKLTTYLNIFSIEIPFYINSGIFKEGQQQFHEDLDIYIQYEARFNPVQNAFVQYYIAYLYFGNKQFKETIFWLNKVMNNTSIKEREDIFVFARILHLIAHYELQNYDYLEYELKNSKTFLSKKERNYQVEKSSIKLLNELVLYPEKANETFINYMPEFELYFKSQYNVFGYFNFLAWFKQKQNNSSFEDEFHEFI
jgi:hypothetical protein